MPSAKDKKSKNKLLKIDVSSGSDSDGSEHELSYYAKDKVKLMKEVLKLIKPKKIKSMAPECIKNLDIVEINSMLLEELLGISNKRLQYIFNGENVDRETSSSESEEEKQLADVISLDDISDDDDIELCVSQNEKDSLEPELPKKNKKLKSRKIKTEIVATTIKLEKIEKSGKENKKKPKKSDEPKKTLADLKETDKDKLMSVLELLELQARARAIRSQLAIETEKKRETESLQSTIVKQEEGSDSDAIIIESPEHKEIAIISSDSEEESCKKISQTEINQDSSTSELLFKHHHIADFDSAPPQKKQKSLTLKDQELFNITEQENRVDDIIINFINTDERMESIDETHKSKESDNKKKKEKLLAKIQKIKLVRNRITAHNKLNPEVINETNGKISKPNNKEDNNETAYETPIENSEASSTVKEVNQENLLKTIAESSGLELDNSKKNCEVVNDIIKEDQDNSNEEVRNGESTNTLNENSSIKMYKNGSVSYCDNDEIVINLDEDEMDGIEND